MKPVIYNLSELNLTKKTSIHLKNRKSITHDVEHITYNGSSWYCKKMQDDFVHHGKSGQDISETEQIVQEFFALVNPHQPRTIRAKDNDGIYYILTEEVKGFRKFDCNDLNNYRKFLGDMLIYALLFEEFDLKHGNFGLNKLNQVVKLDGDWSFATTTKVHAQSKYNLIPGKTIEFLPYPTHNPYNWLGVRKHGLNSCVEDEFINYADLHGVSDFRNDINRGLLNIIVLPESFFQVFVSSYSEGKTGKQYIEILKSRRIEFQNCALQNISFLNYLKENKLVKSDLELLLTNLKNFKVCDESLFTDSVYINLENEIRTNFNKLQDQSEKSFEYISDLKKLSGLFSSLKKYGAVEHDKLLTEYINKQNDNIHELLNLSVKNEIDKTKLQNLQGEYKQAFAALTSEDYTSVLVKANEFKTNKNSNEIGFGYHSHIVLSALELTPVMERRTVLERKKETNLVQETLRCTINELRQLEPKFMLKVEYMDRCVKLNNFAFEFKFEKIAFNDHQLIEFITNTRDHCQKLMDQASRGEYDLVSLEKLELDIKEVYKSVHSKEVEQVINLADKLRRNASSFFAIGNKLKSQALLRELHKIPLKERGSVISSKTPNKVQQIIATSSLVMRLGILNQPGTFWDTSEFKELKNSFRKK